MDTREGPSVFFTGLLSGTLLVLDDPNWKICALLVIAVWSSCRFYYSAFYVLEKYADPTDKFSGLIPMVSYLLLGRQRKMGSRKRRSAESAALKT